MFLVSTLIHQILPYSELPEYEPALEALIRPNEQPQEERRNHAAIMLYVKCTLSEIPPANVATLGFLFDTLKSHLMFSWRKYEACLLISTRSAVI